MTKRIILIILLVLITLCPFIWVFSDLFQWLFSEHTTIGARYSASMKQSMEIGTYLHSYYPIDVKINDTIKFTVKEAFAEKRHGQYSYENDDYRIEKKGSQVIIITKEDVSLMKGYWYNWDFADFTNIRRNAFYCNYKNIAPNNIVVYVIKCDRSIKLDTIGRFKLVKMK